MQDSPRFFLGQVPSLPPELIDLSAEDLAAQDYQLTRTCEGWEFFKHPVQGLVSRQRRRAEPPARQPGEADDLPLLPRDLRSLLILEVQERGYRFVGRDRQYEVFEDLNTKQRYRRYPLPAVIAARRRKVRKEERAKNAVPRP